MRNTKWRGQRSLMAKEAHRSVLAAAQSGRESNPACAVEYAVVLAMARQRILFRLRSMRTRKKRARRQRPRQERYCREYRAQVAGKCRDAVVPPRSTLHTGRAFSSRSVPRIAGRVRHGAPAQLAQAG